jgi:hypothetical protein
MLLVGSLLSWIEVYLPYRNWFEVSSFERAGDGLITLEISLLLIALAWSDRAAGGRIAPLALGPFVLGVAAAFVMRDAMGDALIYLDGLRINGGHGYLLPGFWLATAGAFTSTIAGAVRIYRIRREIKISVGLAPGPIAAVIGAVLGALGGFFMAVTVGGLLTKGAIATTIGSVVTLLTIALGFGGAWLGATLLRWLATSYLTDRD